MNDYITPKDAKAYRSRVEFEIPSEVLFNQLWVLTKVSIAGLTAVWLSEHGLFVPVLIVGVFLTIYKLNQ